MSTAGVRFCERPFQSDINEEPHNISQEAERNNSTGVSKLNTHIGVDFASFCATIGIPELQQIMKHKTFTRSEAQCLIELVHSRTMEESPSSVISPEASTSGSQLKKRNHGDESDNFHAAVVGSRVVEEEITSSAELAKAYKGSTIGTGQAPRKDIKLIKNNATKSPMASSQHSTTMENLPEELLSNIFIRLLAKQLAQMRSVNKSWNSLLSHSSFVKSHLRRSIHNKDQILLIFHNERKSSSDFKPFTAKPTRSPYIELTNFIKLPPVVNLQFENANAVRVIGSVNGLICSSYYENSDIHIWNPSLSAVLTLPPYSTPPGDCDSVECYFRFGYDPKTDDYKVIKLTGLTRPPSSVVKWWLQIEIYSMRKGAWELITERFPSHITAIVDDDDVCVDGHDGHIHWRGCIGEKMDSERIVAFDLGSETFREMPLPDSILDDIRDNYLGVLAKKLCVMSYVIDDGAYEVWVMEEYGVAESWVKRHVISDFFYESGLFGFTSRCEFLAEDDGNIVLIDPSTHEEKLLGNRFPKDYGATKFVEYVDSLVWVAPDKQT